MQYEALHRVTVVDETQRHGCSLKVFALCRVTVVMHDTHRHGCVDGCVGADAEVGSWDVVADGGRNDAHRDAELVIATARINQLQDSLICLQENANDNLCNRMTCTFLCMLIYLFLWRMLHKRNAAQWIKSPSPK